MDKIRNSDIIEPQAQIKTSGELLVTSEESFFYVLRLNVYLENEVVDNITIS